MDNDISEELYIVHQDIRKEIFGVSYELDESKKATLTKNILNNTLFGVTTPMDAKWALSLLPLVKRLCSLPHVHIVDSLSFLSFEFEKGTLKQTPHIIKFTMVASFSGFVDAVERGTHRMGVPIHYYIYNFEEQDVIKSVRYITYITPNKIIDACKKT